MGLDLFLSEVERRVGQSVMARIAFQGAYLDDHSVVAKAEDAIAFLKATSEVSEEGSYGLTVRVEKCGILTARPDLVRSLCAAEGDWASQIPVTNVGLTVLGAPVGSLDFSQAHWKAHAAGMISVIEGIKTKLQDPQLKLSLLRFCGVTQATHMVRTGAPEHTEAAARLVDAAAEDCLKSLLFRGPHNDLGVLSGRMRDQARLPVRMGGLGIISAAEIARCAHIASFGDAFCALRAVRAMIAPPPVVATGTSPAGASGMHSVAQVATPATEGVDRPLLRYRSPDLLCLRNLRLKLMCCPPIFLFSPRMDPPKTQEEIPWRRGSLCRPL